ncbi:hypothetical protein Y032_0211g2176 [Ancylostoma ceylanicum]|uniref:Uncharacterized protein n=1 Tax=Ancylostoma ceylanicum TaxID=53326 RepID=A0A016SKX5_9BILA|nr:hypothetical protein Y032_0211g2176 [Ancylostoma ceylanicum]
MIKPVNKPVIAYHTKMNVKTNQNTRDARQNTSKPMDYRNEIVLLRYLNGCEVSAKGSALNHDHEYTLVKRSVAEILQKSD